MKDIKFINLKKIDERHLYKFFIENILDDLKYMEFDFDSRIITALITLHSPVFPEVQDFFKELSVKEGIEFDWFEGDRKKWVSFADAVIKKSSEAKDLIQRLSASLKENGKESEFLKRAEYLKETFQINEIDLKCIFGLIILKKISEPKIKLLPCFFGSYLERGRSHQRIYNRSHLLSYLGEDQHISKTVLSKSSNIVQTGLVSLAYFDAVEISEALYEYFLNPESDSKSLHNCEARENERVFILDSFKSIDDIKKNLIKNLFSADIPCSALLIGPPGSGKTAFGMSLAKAINKQALFLPTAKPIDGENGISLRKTALSVASLSLNPKSQLLIVDEADDVLNTVRGPMPWSRGGEGNKEYANELLDKSKIQILFISNSQNFDESTLRRFNIVAFFDHPSSSLKREMLEITFQAQQAEHLVSELEIENLIQEDSITQGIISLAIKDAKSVSSDPEVQKHIFHQLINARLEFFNGPNKNKNRRIGLV